MTPAKSGRPRRGAGKVFVDITEKKQLPGFGSFQWGELGVWPAKRCGQEKEFPKIAIRNCNSKINTWRSVINSTRFQEPKWKSWLTTRARFTWIVR